MTFTVEATPEANTRHRSIDAAMKRAAEQWKKGAPHVYVYGEFSSYRLERTNDGTYGYLTNNSYTREVIVNPEYWSDHAARVGLPPLSLQYARLD